MTGRADYYDRRERRRERLEARAERLQRVAATEYRKADLREEVSGIPFGQPILVGHHSEGKHRRTIERANRALDRAIAADKAAGVAAATAANIGANGAISSDNPDALDLLREKLADMEARQEAMKAANAAWRKAGNKAGRQADGTWVEPPCAPYQLSNNSANMQRVRDRIAALERAETRETAEVLHNSGVRLVQNVEANRVQLIFPGKPSAEVRALLKGRGFRWSPMEGAWQRHLNNAGIYAAKSILEDLAK